MGKGSVVARVLEALPAVRLSVSATTRAPRQGEEDGREYHFMTPERFEELQQGNAFLEWAEFQNARYGTLAAEVEAARIAGRDVVLEIEVQGARIIRDRAPESLFIFLVPPSFGELRRRLEQRGTETPEQRAARLVKAEEEMGERRWFHHVVVNDDLDRAAAEVIAILEGT